MPETTVPRADFKVVLTPWSPTTAILPRIILAEGLTYKQAQERAAQARKNYLSPNQVDVQ